MSTRAAMAGAVALLCLFQGLVFAASPHGRTSHLESAGPGVETSVAGQICKVDGGENAPTQTDHGHAQCCILCATSGAHVAPLLVVGLGIAYSALEQALPAGRHVADDTDRRLIGWTTSWSSRAPPFFF